jgi:hypothetical protein
MHLNVWLNFSSRLTADNVIIQHDLVVCIYTSVFFFWLILQPFKLMKKY